MPWLFIAYPLLAHLATVLHSETLSATALAVFIAVPLSPKLLTKSPAAWLLLSSCIVVLAMCAHLGFARLLIYIPPVLIPLVVLLPFARSLAPGNVPLVTRIATQIRGPLPDDLHRYTRHVTQMWVAVLAIQASASLALACFASAELWSLMSNCVSYVILGLIFGTEYLFRRWRFQHLAHESFVTMIRAIATTRMY